jgi:hypothetical protein
MDHVRHSVMHNTCGRLAASDLDGPRLDEWHWFNMRAAREYEREHRVVTHGFKLPRDRGKLRGEHSKRHMHHRLSSADDRKLFGSSYRVECRHHEAMESGVHTDGVDLSFASNLV